MDSRFHLFFPLEKSRYLDLVVANMFINNLPQAGNFLAALDYQFSLALAIMASGSGDKNCSIEHLQGDQVGED